MVFIYIQFSSRISANASISYPSASFRYENDVMSVTQMSYASFNNTDLHDCISRKHGNITENCDNILFTYFIYMSFN